MKKVWSKLLVSAMVLVAVCCLFAGCKDGKIDELAVAKSVAQVELLAYKYNGEFTDMQRAHYLKLVDSVNNFKTKEEVEKGVVELKKQIDELPSVKFVEFSFNAHVIEAGYIVEPTVIMLDDTFMQTMGEKYGKDLATMKSAFNDAYLTDYLLTINGYTPKYYGSLDDGYYLSEVNFAHNNPMNEKFNAKYNQYVEDNKIPLVAPTDFSKLYGGQYHAYSGFLFNINDVSAEVSADKLKPMDNEAVTWYFSIAMGSDYSYGWGGQMVDKVDRKELDILLACADYLGKTDTAVYAEAKSAVATMGVKQGELDLRVKALREELLGK